MRTGLVDIPNGRLSNLLRKLSSPSLSDFLFLAILIWLFVATPGGWSSLLADGDTGWHIRTGDYILDHRAIPHHDIFSFSKPGQTWFAWEWGADVVFALLVRAGGLKALVLFCGVLIALFVTLLFRLALARGANPFITLALSLLAIGATSIHYLARPHLFTLVLLPVSLAILERDRHIWLLVPLTVLWTNLHGGFMAFLACFALWLITHPTLRLTACLLLCSAATLVNPYGYQLHGHILSYLRSDWIRNVVHEFQSPSFRSENMAHYEILLLVGLMTAGSLLLRRRYTESLWILFWAHQSLVSVRHVTVYAAVAVPLIAAELTDRWNLLTLRYGPRSVAGILDAVARDTVPQFRRSSLWPAFAVASLLVVPGHWPTDFPAVRFPIPTIEKFSARFPQARLLTVDQWADYLLFRFYPRVRVFVDGRSDFYGPQIGKDYLRLLSGQHNWRTLLDRYRFDLILIPPDWALATLLKEDRQWKLLADDGAALLFERSQPLPPRDVTVNLGPPLMKIGVSAEQTERDLRAMRSATKTITTAGLHGERVE